MSITLYYAPMSSASPVLWALAELGLEHDAIAVDLKAGEQKQPALMAHNPMGQVPTLVDDGQGMFESTAIFIHLGLRYGVERGVWPAPDAPEHMVALSWLSWFAIALGGSLRTVMLNSGDWIPAEHQSEAQAAKGREQLASLMAILDAHLAERAYLTGDDFCLVDAYGTAIIGWGTHVAGYDMSQVPNVTAWHGRCMARDAVKAMK